MGDPLRSDNRDSNSTRKKKADPRLASGKYTFPFSFPFPTHPDQITNSSALNTNSIGAHTVRNPVSSVASSTSDDGPKNPQKAPRRWIRLFTSTSPTSSSTPSDSSLVSEPHRSSVSPMPQTFMEKDIDPNVAYDISVRIVHGRFKASSK
jgi:hypothetical protein